MTEAEKIFREHRREIKMASAAQTLDLLAQHAEQMHDQLKESWKSVNKMTDQVTTMKRDMRAISKELKGTVPDRIYDQYMSAYDYIRKLHGTLDVAYTEMLSAANMFDTVMKESDKLN